jgi:hypothetical protein
MQYAIYAKTDLMDVCSTPPPGKSELIWGPQTLKN